MEELKVKVGDKVLYRNHNGRYITTVERVTPTGRIRVKHSSSQFNKYGDKMGSCGVWGGWEMISIPTERDIEAVRKEQTIFKASRIIKDIARKKLEYDEAVRILEFFERR